MPNELNPADHECTKEPVCPHCGEVIRDAWEINFGDGMEGKAQVDCPSCEEPFIVYRTAIISYSTRIEMPS